MLIFSLGGAIGLAGIVGMARMLDPPPDRLSMPWLYVVGLVAAAIVSIAIAVIGAQHSTRIPAAQRLGDSQ